jgi:hypothetical protein
MSDTYEYLNETISHPQHQSNFKLLTKRRHEKFTFRSYAYKLLVGNTDKKLHVKQEGNSNDRDGDEPFFFKPCQLGKTIYKGKYYPIVLLIVECGELVATKSAPRR